MAPEREDRIHVIPINDLVEHDTSGDQDCICGPSEEAVMRDDGSNGWLVTHHSLDGRELHEQEVAMSDERITKLDQADEALRNMPEGGEAFLSAVDAAKSAINAARATVIDEAR